MKRSNTEKKTVIYRKDIVTMLWFSNNQITPVHHGLRVILVSVIWFQFTSN